MGLQRYDSEVPSYLLQCCLSICTDNFLLTLCRDERERDKLDLMIVSIILILQRLLLVLITFCTIYVVCKSSDLHCAPNNSRAVCLSCSSLSLLLWKQIVPCFIGRIFFFFCDRFGYDASGIESPGIILYNQVLLEEFLEDG